MTSIYLKIAALPIIAILLIYTSSIERNNVRIAVPMETYAVTDTYAVKENKTKIKYILQYQRTGSTRLCLDDKFKGCEYESCLFTRDFKMMPIEEFDAILFHEPEAYSNRIPPKERRPFQKYIYYSLESPVSHPIVYREPFYNLTLNYRRDSDIYYPYARVEKRPNELSLNLTLIQEQMTNKTKLVAWVVSNCGTRGVHDRQTLHKELSKHIPVDVFGKCGNLTCPGWLTEECYKIIDQNYKFYLAFENSYCPDYITEKPLNILNKTNLIPIVFGFNDYIHLLPPHSAINVEDYETAKDLADYLLFLDKNPEEYMKFLIWKKHYWIDFDVDKRMCCDLCKKLHEPLEYSWYESMEQWAACPEFNNTWTKKN